MATSHMFSYSKSARARCHAPPPCQNTPLPIGTLRYGRITRTESGETVEWRHWGCVNKIILAQLASVSLDTVDGFKALTAPDQQKIRQAVSMRTLDPADIPASAKAPILEGAGSKASKKNASQSRLAQISQALAASGSSQKRTASQAGLNRFNQIRQALVDVPSPSMPSTQQEADEPPEEEFRDEIYCNLNTNVVGIQYYKGLVGPGEEVLLVREPHNPYDKNAIQVKNISGLQVGHLPKNVAAKLAPLLDRHQVTVEGVINDGNLGGSKAYTLSITLKIYGLADKRAELEPLLVWATPGQRGFPSRRPSEPIIGAGRSAGPIPVPLSSQYQAIPSSSQQGSSHAQLAAQQETIRKHNEAIRNAEELRQTLASLEKVNDEGRRSSLLDTLCSTEDVLNLPVHPNPPSIASGELTVDLLRHQLQALQWCIAHENPVLPKTEKDKPVQFWQLRKRGNQTYYYNIATKTPQTEPPVLGRGALCADAMGLGKTLTMLSLVLATKKEKDDGFSKTTLIVSPLSVLSNWEKQIADHCSPGALSVCTYYGANRGISPAELQKYDVVITTYQTVAGEFENNTNANGPMKKKRKTESTLFEVPWKRAILDEGHNIRNPKTKMAQAVVALHVSRRWVLTGTPIINSPRDLGSIMSFLRICRPLDNEDFYKRLLLRPLKNGEPSGVELLRALMTHICIRRTKEMQDSTGKTIIELPPVEMIKVPVALSKEARELYDEVEEISKQRLENALRAGMNAGVQHTVLSMLTRMRQIALHPGLVPANYLEQLRAADTSEYPTQHAMAITPEEKFKLQQLLVEAIENSEECPICFGVLPNDARITTCAHMFCLACITEIISRDPKCPMDRRFLTMADLHEPLPPTDLTQKPTKVSEEPEGIRAGSSAKTEQLVHLLQLTPATEKSLVFSQFTSFLDKIAETLEEHGIPYVRFDGQMSAKRRQEAIARFSVPVVEEPLVPEAPIPEHRPRRAATSTKVAEANCVDQDGDDSEFIVSDNDVASDESDDMEDVQISKKSKGKGKQKAKEFTSPLEQEENPRVMLLSLKAGALGLNLTVANNVYLMDPWWQEGIESQAVDRVNRIGQTKPVHVYQLIAENTVESKVLEIQEKKKALIQQAFSGIKRTETQRQQREARLQDLVELFGLRASQIQPSLSH